MNMDILILKKIKQRGFNWFLARLLQESERAGMGWGALLKLPMFFIYYLVLKPISKWQVFFYRQGIFCKDTLYLFYDFEVSPVTFDFAWALALAEQERRHKMYKNVHVVFVPGNCNGLREEMLDYEKNVDLHARYWRRSEIIFAMCDMLPTYSGMTLCSTREEAVFLWNEVSTNFFPRRYTPYFPIAPSTRHLFTCYDSSIMMCFHATEQSKRYIQQWLLSRLLNRKLITITLRNSSYAASRNSRFSAWIDFAKTLNTKKYFVVFVPDTESAFDPLPLELESFCIFGEISWNLNLRAALYEISYLNLGVNNGVMALCWLNAKCRYLTFKMMVPNEAQTSKSAFRAHGFEIGKSLSFASPFQKWIWEDDSAEVIGREFRAMCNLIENG